MEVEYVAVAPEGLVRPESVSAEAALKWYEANKQRFRQPEQVKVAHILVPGEGNSQAASEAERGRGRPHPQRGGKGRLCRRGQCQQRPQCRRPRR